MLGRRALFALAVPPPAREAATVRLGAPGDDANHNRLIAWAGERMAMRYGIRVRHVRGPGSVDVVWRRGEPVVVVEGRAARMVARFLASAEARWHARMLAANDFVT